jgi:hypothetical protein
MTPLAECPPVEVKGGAPIALGINSYQQNGSTISPNNVNPAYDLKVLGYVGVGGTALSAELTAPSIVSLPNPTVSGNYWTLTIDKSHLAYNTDYTVKVWVTATPGNNVSGNFHTISQSGSQSSPSPEPDAS